MYSPKTRAELGKFALKIGSNAVAKRASIKLGFLVNESTTRRFKKLYLEERMAKQLREEDDLRFR